MKRLIIGVLSLIASLSVWSQPYDTSAEVIESTYKRSIYYTADSYPLPLKVEEFLNEANRSVPVVLHAHGCSGVGWDEQRLGAFYSEQKVNIVMLDFLKIKTHKPSCDAFPKAGGWPEVSNPDRIAARRMELESQVQWLKDQGFEKIFVSGHSEGGRTVQGLKTEVAGVFIYSMDCKISMRQFWTPNPKNKIKVFISSRDPWLDYPQVPIRGCKSMFDRQVSEYWSAQNSHSVLLEKEWRDALARDLRH